MEPVIIYARRLQAGETPPTDQPGNSSPLFVNDDGKLLVDVASVQITLPGGGVNLTGPLGPGGGLRVEATAGVPMEVAFLTPQDVNLTGPLSAGGGVLIAPTPGEPLEVQFPSAQAVKHLTPQDVKFATPQQVTFPSAQPVAFSTPQQVTFPAAQPVGFVTPPDVKIVDPVGVAGGVKVEPTAGAPLNVQFPSAQPVAHLTPQEVKFAAPQQVTFPAAQDVQFAAPQEVEITSPLGAGGGVRVEPTSGVPLNVQFPAAQSVKHDTPQDVKFATAQQVTFPSAQPVAHLTPQDVKFAAPQEVIFPSAQQVSFPSAQPVTVSGPVGGAGGVQVQNAPGNKLAVDFAGSIPEFSLAPGLTDPFSRLRTSEPITLFDSKFIYDKHPDDWGEVLAGSGTSIFVANGSHIALAVTAASGDRAARQSFDYVPYQPGKGRLMFMTGVMTTGAKANCVSRIGLFDDVRDKTAGNDVGGDGVFYELNGTTMFAVVRSYVGGVTSEERAAQSTWNIDKMDGTGPSGITLDWSKSQIFVIDLEWLGVGTVTFGVAYNRKLYLTHQFHHANSIVGVYMRSADLPVRYEIENIGATSGPTTLRQICCTVISEGGFAPEAKMFSVNNGLAIKVVNATETAMAALRIRPDRCREKLRLIDINFELATTDTTLIRIYAGVGTAASGGAFVNASTTDSKAQHNLGVTGFTPGTLRFSGFITTNNRRLAIPANVLPVETLTDIQGNPVPIVITAQNQTGTADVLMAISWGELN